MLQTYIELHEVQLLKKQQFQMKKQEHKRSFMIAMREVVVKQKSPAKLLVKMTMLYQKQVRTSQIQGRKRKLLTMK